MDGRNHCNFILDQLKNSKFWTKVVIDFVLLLLVGFSVLAFFLFGKPYKRGFYCSDTSLHYPFNHSQVTSTALYTIGIFLPFLSIITLELITFYKSCHFGGRRRFEWIKLKTGPILPSLAVMLYQVVGWFLFGAAVQQLVTDVGKYSIGRLRPHFHDVCVPHALPPFEPFPVTDQILQQVCRNTQPISEKGCIEGKYIVKFICCGNSTSHRMREIRLSFPSGHASFSTYTMGFLAVYLQYRMTGSPTRLIRPVLQLLVLLATWFTALSRVSDYKHHPTDVLAGAVIGIVVLAAIVICGSPFTSPAPYRPGNLPYSQNDQNGEIPEVPLTNLEPKSPPPATSV